MSEVLEIETLEDRFARFQSEVKKLNQKPEALTKELSVKQEKLERLRAGHLAQLALGEIKKAATLNKQIEPLAEEVEVLATQISAFGQSAQTLISNAPGSELFDLAAGIVDESADICLVLEAKLQKFVTWGADELKQKYIDEIEKFASDMVILWETAFARLTAQKYLPEDLRICKKPRLIPPMQSL